MARQAKQKLTDTYINNTLKSGSRPYKAFDEGTPYPCLYLEIFPDGAKRWRYKYRNLETGKYVPLGLGVYPRVSLKEARERHAEAARLVEQGIIPQGGEGRATGNRERCGQLRGHRPRVAGQVRAIAGGRLHQIPCWPLASAPVPLDRRPAHCRHHPARASGNRAPLEAKGHIETAHRALELAGQVFNYAIQTGRTTANPAHPLKGALPPAISKDMATVTRPEEVGRLLVDIDQRYTASFITLCAL